MCHSWMCSTMFETALTPAHLPSSSPWYQQWVTGRDGRFFLISFQRCTWLCSQRSMAKKWDLATTVLGMRCALEAGRWEEGDRWSVQMEECQQQPA